MNDPRPEALIRTLRPCRAAVIGDVMLDRYVMGNTGRISPEVPIPGKGGKGTLRKGDIANSPGKGDIARIGDIGKGKGDIANSGKGEEKGTFLYLNAGWAI